MNWIEIKLSVDGEAAEAVAEVLQRYGHQGVAVEQEGILPDYYDDGDVPPAQRLTVRAYIPNNSNAEQAKNTTRNRIRSHEYDVPHANARILYYQ